MRKPTTQADWSVARKFSGQTTPVRLPGKSHGRRSLLDYSPQGRKESDTTERLHYHHSRFTSQSCPLTPQTEAAHFIQLQGGHGRPARVGRPAEGGRLSGSDRGPSRGPPLSGGVALGTRPLQARASLPGASTGDPAHDKVVRRDLAGKASQVSRGPLPERLPRNRNLSVYSHLYSSDRTGGYPQPPFSGKS